MSKQQTATASTTAPAETRSNSAPTELRFDHPQAFSVYVLTPNDSKELAFVMQGLQDEFDMLETPPTLIREFRKDQMFPGVVLYVAHRAVVRERDAETKKFSMVKRLHVSRAIHLSEFYGKTKGTQGGLDFQKLLNAVNESIVRDPRGLFYLARNTQDFGIRVSEI
jgi:hypothetical protein